MILWRVAPWPISFNNMGFSLDCGTLWLELVNGNGETKKQSWNSEIFPQKSLCGGFQGVSTL